MLGTILLITVLIILSVATCLRSVEQSSEGLLSFSTTNCLRGIAILLIMVGHVSGTMNTVVFSPLASTGVALFLIISGYGLNESYKKHGLEHFWRKKVLRVLLPYSFVFICLALYKQDWSPMNWILNLLGLQTSYWFIAFIVKCYIIFWLSSLLLPKYRIATMIVLSIGLLMWGDGLEAPQAFSFVLGVIISKIANYPPIYGILQIGTEHVIYQSWRLEYQSALSFWL